MYRLYSFYCLLASAMLVASVTSSAYADDSESSLTEVATPILRIAMQSPEEINLGKSATFLIHVANRGDATAAQTLVSTVLPEHLELVTADPEPIEVEGNIYKFQVGDVAPRSVKRITLVAIPRETTPVKLRTTVVFATSAQAMAIVRKPELDITVQAPANAVLGDEVDWVVRITNTGDGRADDVKLTPTLVDGEVEGRALRNTVQVGRLKAGETKEYQFSAVVSTRGEVTAKFEGSTPDGLTASQELTLNVLQAELSLEAIGAQVLPIGRDGLYEIRLKNTGDAPTSPVLVTAQIPEGIEITDAVENAYREDTRTLRWRVSSVEARGTIPIRFRAEGLEAGDSTIDIKAQSRGIDEVKLSHTTRVISRSNLVVTVVNDREVAEVGEPIAFRIVVVNAGSRSASDLDVRVSLPEALVAQDTSEYEVRGAEVVFPSRSLKSGEKATLVFQAQGRDIGEQRVKVRVGCSDLQSDLTFEGTAFLYRNEASTAAERTVNREPRELTPIPLEVLR